jgi:hypothetical protein
MTDNQAYLAGLLQQIKQIICELESNPMMREQQTQTYNHM